MPANPQAHPFHKIVDFRVDGRAPRRQSAALRLKTGQYLLVGGHDPVQCAVQVDPLFVHDDWENIVVVSPCLLKVVRVHVLLIFVR